MTKHALLEDMDCRGSEELSALLDIALTPAQKQYIMLYYSSKLTMREIAGIFGVTPSTVSRTISRAAKRLRRAAEVSTLIQPRRQRIS